jgi:hypothetical protein
LEQISSGELMTPAFGYQGSSTRTDATEEKNMKDKLLLPALPLLILFLTLAPAAMASNLWYVDGVHGNDQNNCRTPVTACRTIGHAVSLASSGDSIFVAGATYPENLTISFNLSVVGANPATTIVDGGGINTVITISGGNVNLSRLTIRNGHAPSGSSGGGINNYGTLMINNSNISGNVCAGLVCYGGGISNEAGHQLTVNNSTIVGNSSHFLGGGVADNGTATINNSTIVANYAPGGGGIWVGGSGTASLSNSTVSNNRGASRGTGLQGAVTVKNSIVAMNSGGGNCDSHVVSSGYNLSSDNTCNFHQMGDLNNRDPLLGPLQNNGGPTQTQALLDGSPAIDSGNPSGCTDGNGHLLTTDQRGMPRPDHEDTGGCDMGAYERQSD